MKTIEKIRTKVDWPTTLIPFTIVLILMVVFMLIPEQSKIFVDTVRGFLGDTCGLYYALFGVAVLTTTMYIAFSKYGKVKLGKADKPFSPRQDLSDAELEKLNAFARQGGSFLFTAFFMATDYTTSPLTGSGRCIFGLLLGASAAFLRHAALCWVISRMVFGGNLLILWRFSQLSVPLPLRSPLPRHCFQRLCHRYLVSQMELCWPLFSC